MATLSTLLVKLGLDDKRFHSGVKRAVAGLKGLVGQAEKLSTVGKVAGLATLAAGALALSSAIVPAAGAMLLLPAAAGLAGAAFATLKVATAGLGDAFGAVASEDAKKLEEALKKLSPAARSFVLAWKDIRESFKPIQQFVQQRLFSGLGKDLRSMATGALPVLKSGMADVAGEFNGLGRATLAVMSTPLFRGQLATVLDGSARATRTFGGVLPPLITVLMQLASLGLPLISRFNAWAAGALKSAAAFLTSERGTARLNAMLDRGVAVMGQVVRVAKNLGIAIAGILGAANLEGASLLSTIEGLTAQFATWAQSAEGQQQLAEIFRVLGQIARDLLAILPGIASVIGVIAGVFTSLPGPVQSTVSGFLAWSIVLGGIAGKLAGLTTGLFKLGGGLVKLGKSEAMKKLGTRAKDMAKSVGEAAVTARTRLATLAASARTSLAATATSVGSASARAGTALLNMGRRAAVASAQAVAAFARMAASAVASAATMVARMVATAAVVAARWAWMGVQALLHAGRMALAWVIAMGPIGWVIAAVVALVALIILNWDRIKAVTTKIFSAVWAFLKRVWAGVVSTVQAKVNTVLAVIAWFAALPGRVSAWFAKLKAAAVAKLQALVAWVRGIPGRILSALGRLGNLLWDAGRSVIEGLINGIKSAFGWLQDTLGWVTSIIPSWKGPLSTDRKLLLGAGQAIMGGLIDGILSQRRVLHRELTGIGTDVSALMGRAAGNLALPDAGLALAGGMPTPAGVRAARGGAPVLEIKGDDSRTGRFLLALLREAAQGRGGDVQNMLQGRR